MCTAKAEKTAFFFPPKGVLKTNRTMIKTVSFLYITKIPLLGLNSAEAPMNSSITSKIKSEQLHFRGIFLTLMKEHTQKKKSTVSVQG